MENPHLRQRIKAIYQMLFEMASGNLAFRLEPSGHDDALDKFARTLGLVAEQMQWLILESGHINPHYNPNSLVHISIVLDNQFTITGFNHQLLKTLQYEREKLLGLYFGSLLAPQSVEIWAEMEILIPLEDFYHDNRRLVFLTGRQKLLQCLCTVSRLQPGGFILVNSITTIMQELTADTTVQHEPGLEKHPDAEVIQKLYDYILEHLDEPLPTLPELSILFDTNEYKLKHGFRDLFHTGIYHFYHEQRLKRAHSMIQQGNFTLTQIAFKNGFKSYLNFYKAFKKKYGYPPGDVERANNKSF